MSSSKSTYGLSLHVTVTIAPENVPAFLAAMKPVYDLVAAEPECVYFEVFAPEEPGVLNWVENWNATKEWLLTKQLPKEYYKEYFAITEPMFIKPRQFKILPRMKPEDWTRTKEQNLKAAPTITDV